MIQRQILTCFFLFAFIPLSVNAFPPASPAGGNYLVLDGVNDYAVLNFETFGILLPEGTDEFTVEAWVYPTKPPAKNMSATILSQQVRIIVASDNDDRRQGIKEFIDWQKGDLLLLIDAHVAGWGGGGTTPFKPMTLTPNQWHHIAYQAKGRETITIANDLSKILPQGTTIGHDLSKFWRPKNFTLGGFGKKIAVLNRPHYFWGSFTGYIDEVRISTVARYDITKQNFTPNEKFKNDGETVALWHFDEPGGARRFSDSSDNAYHLVGNGGAKTGNPLTVAPMGKLTTIWGSMKRSWE